MAEESSGIWTSCSRGDLDRLRSCLSSSTDHDINWRHPNKLYRSALHEAIIHNHISLAQELIVHGAEVDCRDSYNMTPLYVAAWYGFVEGVKILLNAHADIHAVNYRNESALHGASENGHVAVVVLLLERGARVDALDVEHASPLHCASQHEMDEGPTHHIAVIKQLLQRSAAINAQDYERKTALHYAVSRQHSAVVQCLLDLNADVGMRDSNGNTPLHDATRSILDSSIVVSLVSSSSDIRCRNGNQQTPLHLASRQSRELAAVMIVAWANHLHPLNTRRHIRIQECITEITRTFHNISSNEYDDILEYLQHPLHVFTLLGDYDACEAVVSQRPGVVNDGDYLNHTPLHLAALLGNENLCKLFLLNGADLRNNDSVYGTPLCIALSHSHVCCAATMLLVQITKRGCVERNQPADDGSEGWHSMVLGELTMEIHQPSVLGFTYDKSKVQQQMLEIMALIEMREFHMSKFRSCPSTVQQLVTQWLLVTVAEWNIGDNDEARGCPIAGLSVDTVELVVATIARHYLVHSCF